MLLAGLEDSDPVFIFEHATLYPVEAEIDENGGPVDITRATVRREGEDVTLITYGGSLGKALQAAELLGKEDIDAEVVDLRTLRPLDSATILNSVAKTHRAVVIDETCVPGAAAK
jgi:pyruvate dehydrogenase E1 component beta subunit